MIQAGETYYHPFFTGVKFTTRAGVSLINLEIIGRYLEKSECDKACEFLNKSLGRHEKRKNKSKNKANQE